MNIWTKKGLFFGLSIDFMAKELVFKTWYNIRTMDILISNLTTSLQFGVIVSKSLLVVKIDDDSFLQGQLKLCDFIVKIDNQRITSKAEFYVHMRNMRRSGEEVSLMLFSFSNEVR